LVAVVVADTPIQVMVVAAVAAVVAYYIMELKLQKQ
jgi:hypothetical protein